MSRPETNKGQTSQYLKQGQSYIKIAAKLTSEFFCSKSTTIQFHLYDFNKTKILTRASTNFKVFKKNISLQKIKIALISDLT